MIVTGEMKEEGLAGIRGRHADSTIEERAFLISARFDPRAALSQLQVSCTVSVAGVDGACRLKVPVSVTGPLVGNLQTAVPFVESLALLIWMAVESGLDQLP